MKISYKWLQEYLDLDLPAKEVAEKIERSAVEVDSVTVPMDGLKKIVVGEVISLEDHPDSDHLHITETEIDGGETLQIVCGAPNIEAGQKVVVAKPGAMMPDGQMIWPGNLRGVDSFGMICSAKELHLPNAPEKRGILVLAEDAKVGEKFEVSK